MVFLVHIFLALSLFCAPARADRDKLEAIASRAADLPAFLADRALVEEYFRALQEHYGKDRFPRSAYDAILKKLRVAIAKEPRLAARLWETGGMGQSFTVTVTTGASGTRLDPAKWREEKERWETALSHQAGPLVSLDPEARDRELRAIFARVEARVSEINQAIAQENDPKKKVELQKRLFGGLAADTGLDRAAAIFVTQYFKKRAVRAAFDSGDADLVTDVIREARGDAKLVAGAIPGFESAPSALIAEIRRALPDANHLLRQPGLFVPIEIASNTFTHIPIGATQNGTYRFDPPRRRFHALWKGIPDKECVGGICEPAHDGYPKKEPSLERVLTIALAGSELHEVSLNGKVLGFVHAVPIEREGLTFGSLELGASVLRRNVVVRDPDGTRRSVPLLNLWHEEAMKAIPPHWKGFVLGTSRVVNNANVIDGAHASDMYLLGEVLGDARYFHPGDPLAKVIPDLDVRRGDAAWVGGRMMFDAALYNQGELTLLAKPDPQAMLRLLRADALRSYFARVRDDVRRVSMFERVAATGTRDPQVQRVLVDELLNDRKPEREWGIDRLFREDAHRLLAGLPIEDPVVLSRLVEGLKGNHDDDLFERVKDLLVRFAKDRPETQKEIARLLGHPDPHVRRRAETLLGKLAPTDEGVISVVHGFLFDKNASIRRSAVRALGEMRVSDPRIHADVERLLGRKAERAAATRALAQMRPPAEPVAPVFARIDGTEKLPSGIADFLHDEQVMHYKGLWPESRFSLDFDPTYKQENRAKFPVPYYLIPAEGASFRETSGLSPEVRAQLLVRRDGKLYYKFLVHPLSERYFSYLKETPGVEYVGPEKTELTGSVTSSFRSLLVWNDKEGGRPFMAKLGADLHEEGYHRLVDDAEVEKSFTNQRALDALGADYLRGAKAKIFPETAGLTLRREHIRNGPSTLGGQIIREIPDEVMKGEKRWISMASLMSPEGGREKPLIMEVIARSGLSSAAFVKERLIDDYVHLFEKIALDKGLPFQPTGQNLYLETRADYAPTGFFALRDAEGIFPDLVQAAHDAKLREIYSGTESPSSFWFDTGRVYAAGAFMRDYRNDVFVKLLEQIRKHDPSFSKAESMKLLRALDAKLIEMICHHYNLPHLPELVPPFNAKLLTRLEGLIREHTRFHPRPEHQRIEHDEAVSRYLRDKHARGELVPLYADPAKRRGWRKFDAYLSDIGIELVDPAGNIAAYAPFNAREREEHHAGRCGFKKL